MAHPLDEEFGFEEAERLESIEIPESAEERDLDLVIKFALDTYKMQMDDIDLIEPKNRLKYLELARDFLAQAKDAMAKRDKLKLDREKMMRSGTKTTQPASSQDGEDSDDASQGISRAALTERLRKTLQ
ncbi:MAG: hypothetical protein CMF22_11460 [Idiomarinaceae bacterium]|nr:hypothetical protein [Idiomarinaceae bacterium]|tara:strand:+ start:88436 stop:88822 length:387 start_codon:yes stop_codon:yes gene_type:complete